MCKFRRLELEWLSLWHIHDNLYTDLLILNWVTLNLIRIRIGSVHTYSYEACLAKEPSLTTCTSVAEGLEYLS